MIITRQDPYSFRLQTGETVVNFNAEQSTLELKVAQKRLFIDTPGEYEMEGIAIEGAPGAFNGTAHENNISYTIHWDDMTIGLGSAPQEIPYDVFLLLVAQPRNDEAQTLTAMDARILIPFGDEKMVTSFLKELDESAEEMEKLTLKKKDIPPKGERKIVLLKPLKK